MEHSDINIYTLYDHVNYIHDTTDRCLIISWDDRNRAMNKCMANEAFFFNANDKPLSSHYWVEEIKKISDWKMGETIHLMILNVLLEKSPMKVFWSKTKSDTFIYEKINEEGYLFVNWYDDEIQLRSMVKKDCLYNRDWQEFQEIPYVLK